MLNELFKPGLHTGSCTASELPVFQQMLKAHNGKVHFLYFWSAFSKASRLLANSSTGPEGDRLMANIEEGLTLELETLRDGILRAIEVAQSPAAVEASASQPPSRSTALSMSTGELMEELRKAASMSSAPDFWHAAGQAISVEDPCTQLSLEDITVAILSWLRDAITWEHERRPPARSPSPSSLEGDAQGQRCLSLVAPSKKPPSGDGLPVYIHIYDVSQEESIQKINKWLASRYSPLKFGGVFHAGVEVNGLEWSYGMSCSETMPGISCHEPRAHPAHNYRQTVQLRNTKLSAEDLADVLSQLIEEYPGDDYCILRRNCCHFADDFCRRLGAGRLPGWVHRLARLGARVDGALQYATGRKLISSEDSSDDESNYQH
jgi:hypothetical protein